MVQLDGIRSPHQYPAIRHPGRRYFKVGIFLIILAIMVIVVALNLQFFNKLVNYCKLIRFAALSGRYLVLLQNNTELRPSGGFIGSFAVVEMKKGKPQTIYIDTNIYKRDKVFAQENNIKPPYPLNQFIPDNKWTMRDSNWAVDFPEAAQKIAWFYKQEGGTDVDGVVAINASVVKDALGVIGPIDLPKYNTTINEQNFFSEVQYKIDKEYFGNPEGKTANEPKTILKDMLPEFLNRVGSSRYFLRIVGLMFKELSQKQILLNFNDAGRQKIISSLTWGGEVKNPKGDYLFINHANLGANKSSLEVEEKISLNVVSDNGRWVDTLSISRLHHGTTNWPSGDNKNYTRILVPLGSELVAAKLGDRDIAQEVKTTTEAGKTVLGLWFITEAGKTKTLEIKYELPKHLSSDQYSLYWQKQSGTSGDQLGVDVDGKKVFEGWVDKDAIVQ